MPRFIHHKGLAKYGLPVGDCIEMGAAPPIDVPNDISMNRLATAEMKSRLRALVFRNRAIVSPLVDVFM